MNRHKVMNEKTNKQTKSHSGKRVRFFIANLILKCIYEKEKTCENTVFTQVLELVTGFEPATCSLRMSCTTGCATQAYIALYHL